MVADEHRLNAWTQSIIGCAYRVSNALGPGYLEKVYRNALAVEFRKVGLTYEMEAEFKVHYEGVMVGEYHADLIVERSVLIEVKAVRGFDDAHTAQCLNYLTCTQLPICLLLNFGKPRVDIRRLVGSTYPK